jgi:hypothetical protein
MAAEREKLLREYVANLPEPKIINLEALVQFTAPVREFQVGGIGLRAPPLLFELGVRLMVAVNALKACREKRPSEVPAVARTAVSLIRKAVRPTLLRRLRGGWVKTLHQLPSEDVETLLRYLLYVPDESVFPPPTKPGTPDFIASALEVVREFPAWVDHDTGLPRLWSHYVYGSRHLSRVRARQMLLLATAARVGPNADKKEWARFEREESAIAGWN